MLMPSAMFHVSAMQAYRGSEDQQLPMCQDNLRLEVEYPLRTYGGQKEDDGW
jgi:hypothetical protein